MNKIENEDIFIKIIEDIDNILNDNFYEAKESFLEMKKTIQKWHNDFKKSNTLKVIEPEILEQLDLMVTDYFDKYIKTESVKNNYAERLSYDFSTLEKNWKEEMLGGKQIERK